MNYKLNIDKLVSIDDTGLPTLPDIRQLQDKDVLELFKRDTSTDKHKYIQEVGVIYYMGDPKSPARQQGLSDKEALQLAIENYNLPKNYTPDMLVNRLIKKYYKQNITEAGVALEALQQSIHLVSIAATRINKILNDKLSNPLGDDGIITTLGLMKQVSSQIQEIPNLTKAISSAYENLRNEQEEQLARGGMKIMSSMDASEDYD